MPARLGTIRAWSLGEGETCVLRRASSCARSDSAFRRSRRLEAEPDLGDSVVGGSRLRRSSRAPRVEPSLLAASSPTSGRPPPAERGPLDGRFDGPGSPKARSLAAGARPARSASWPARAPRVSEARRGRCDGPDEVGRLNASVGPARRRPKMAGPRRVSSQSSTGRRAWHCDRGDHRFARTRRAQACEAKAQVPEPAAASTRGHRHVRSRRGVQDESHARGLHVEVLATHADHEGLRGGALTELSGTGLRCGPIEPRERYTADTDTTPDSPRLSSAIDAVADHGQGDHERDRQRTETSCSDAQRAAPCACPSPASRRVILLFAGWVFRPSHNFVGAPNFGGLARRHKRLRAEKRRAGVRAVLEQPKSVGP